MNKLLYLSPILLLLFSCSIPGLGDKTPTIAEVREIQTETVKANDLKKTMKAAINTLQDDDFMISYTDLDVGIITAEKSENAESIMDVAITNLLSQLTDGFWNKASKGLKTVYVNINISDLGNEMKIRTSFIAKVFDTSGKLIKQESVKSREVYDTFYRRLRKFM